MLALPVPLSAPCAPECSLCARRSLCPAGLPVPQCSLCPQRSLCPEGSRVLLWTMLSVTLVQGDSALHDAVRLNRYKSSNCCSCMGLT